MGEFRFIHAADLHLGSPFKGLRSMDPHIGELLSSATFSAFDNIINACLEQKVDFLLIAGDIFDAEDRGLKPQLYFREGLLRLSNSGIASFVVHGNHDPLSGWIADLGWSPMTKIFSEKIETVPFVRNGEILAHIQGQSHAKPKVTENLAKRFKHPQDSPFSIGLLHANVGTDTGHDPYAPCTLEDLRSAGLNYWALGHVHSKGVLQEKNPAIVFPGNPQGLHIREIGQRGVYLVHVVDTEIRNLEFLPMDIVRWEDLSGKRAIDFSSVETEDQAMNILEKKCEKLVSDSKPRHIIARLTLSGRTPFHRTLCRENLVSDLESFLREKFAQKKPFAWIDRINNRTFPPIDLEARKSGEDFIAELLKVMDALDTPDQKEEMLKQALSPLYESRAWLRSIPMPKGEDFLRMFEEARIVILNYLIDEETQ